MATSKTSKKMIEKKRAELIACVLENLFHALSGVERAEGILREASKRKYEDISASLARIDREIDMLFMAIAERSGIPSEYCWPSGILDFLEKRTGEELARQYRPDILERK